MGRILLQATEGVSELGHHALISTAQEKNLWGALGCQNQKTDFGIPWLFNLDICPIFFKGGYGIQYGGKNYFPRYPCRN